jgi:hypothetical protein
MTISHPVDEEGRVYCAIQRRVVDVIACYGCTKVVKIDLDSRRPKVTCAVNPSDERDARSG